MIESDGGKEYRHGMAESDGGKEYHHRLTEADGARRKDQAACASRAISSRLRSMPQR